MFSKKKIFNPLKDYLLCQKMFCFFLIRFKGMRRVIIKMFHVESFCLKKKSLLSYFFECPPEKLRHDDLRIKNELTKILLNLAV